MIKAEEQRQKRRKAMKDEKADHKCVHCSGSALGTDRLRRRAGTKYICRSFCSDIDSGGSRRDRYKIHLQIILQ